MSVGRASLILAAMIGFSRLTGLGRMVVTSVFFGRGPDTDAYLAAFNIPDTLSILISGGLLATGFVPVFTAYLARNEQEAAQRTFRSLLTLISVVFGAVSLVLFALTFTPAGTLLAPSKVGPGNIVLYLHILRILLAAQFLFVVGGIFSGTFNALRLFWYPALQPVLFNCGTILFGILGRKTGIEIQAWGALFGAGVGTLVILAPAAVKHGLSLKPLWDLRDEGVKRVGASLLPIVLGLASGQIIALNLPRFFAKSLDIGSTSTLDYANRLMQVPLDVLASGAAVALFPTLSRLWVEDKPEELRAAFGAALQRTLVLMFFAAAMLMALAWPAIHLVLEHGKFKAGDTAITANVLRCYALCLPALGAQQLLARGFYATNRSQEPVGVGVMGIAAFFIFGAIATMFPLPGGAGLALAAVAATTLLSAGLWITLRKHLGDLGDAKIARAAVIGLVLAVVAGLVAWATSEALFHMLRHYDTDLTFGPVKLVVRLVLLAGGAVTGGGLWLMVGKRLGVADLRRKAS